MKSIKLLPFLLLFCSFSSMGQAGKKYTVNWIANKIISIPCPDERPDYFCLVNHQQIIEIKDSAVFYDRKSAFIKFDHLTEQSKKELIFYPFITYSNVRIDSVKIKN